MSRQSVVVSHWGIRNESNIECSQVTTHNLPKLKRKKVLKTKYKEIKGLGLNVQQSQEVWRLEYSTVLHKVTNIMVGHEQIGQKGEE